MRLGNILDTAGLTKDNLMKAVKLGVGAGLFPIVYGWLRGMAVSRVSALKQGSATEYAVRALAGVVLGTATARFGQREAGDGMMAAAIGTIVSDLVAPMLNPAAAAVQSGASSSEAVSGVSAYSASNPMGRSLAGLGYGGNNGDQSLLFGVGTPDMSAARMLSGATVAIEEKGLSGATVAIEQQPSFAGALF